MRSYLLPVLLLAAACSRSSASDGAAARLEADWTGADTGRIATRATAEWCDSLGLLEIRALQGDSGLALALYPGGPVRPDSYPVRPPDAADSAPPAGAVALRWFAETAIKGFQGDSGAIVLERAGGRIAGRFHAALQSVNDPMRLDVRGTFRDLPVVPAARGCVSPATAARADSAADSAARQAEAGESEIADPDAAEEGVD